MHRNRYAPSNASEDNLRAETLFSLLRLLQLVSGKVAEMLTVRTAEHGGRLRKYYRITDKGLARIEDFREEWREVMAIYRFITKDGVEDA